MYREQLAGGDKYAALRPTFSIAIADSVLFPGNDAWHQRFLLTDSATGAVFTRHIETHTIELAKFRQQASDLADDLDRWVFFLRYAEGLDARHLPPALQTPPIERAVGVLQRMTQDTLERQLYELRMKSQRDHAWLMGAARDKGLEEGRAEGRAEGEVIGQIRLLSRLLKRDSMLDERLVSMSIAELRTLANALEQEVTQNAIAPKASSP